MPSLIGHDNPKLLKQWKAINALRIAAQRRKAADQAQTAKPQPKAR